MSASSVRVPLRLPPLSIPEGDVQRSGVRWLCADGQVCRPGEPVGYCNLGLRWHPLRAGKERPFAEESRDFQAAFALRRGGRLLQADGLSRGGFLDLHETYHRWSSGTTIGWLEGAEDRAHPDAAALRVLMLAGRRMTEHADLRQGLLSGWHERSRAWWGEGEGEGEGEGKGSARFGNFLSLGICEQLGIVKGERGAFLELFELLPGPIHVAFTPDDVLVPAAPVLVTQLEQTPADRDRLLEHLVATFGPAVLTAGREQPRTAGDWILAGCLLKCLGRSPLLEPADVLTAAGVLPLGPPAVVLLSLNAERAPLFRHRKLGCFIALHQFRLAETGPAFQRWLRTEFEPVRRSLEDVRRDLLRLIDAVQARTGAQLLILNSMSSSSLEDVSNYAVFEAPLRDTLWQVQTAESNLMLYELARQRDVSVIDVDALALEVGGRRHIPDAVHASGHLQAAVRRQLVQVLRERGVPGCGAASA